MSDFDYEAAAKTLACPACGAYGVQQCSTLSGRDHAARRRRELEIENAASIRESKAKRAEVKL